MPTFDQGQDRSGREILRITEQYGAPEFVKAASSETLCGHKLPRHLYADPLHQLYPVHSAAATWTSYAFFLDKQAELGAPSVRKRLQEMGRYFDIETEMVQLEKRAAERRKDPSAALPDTDFALIWKQADGTVQRKVRLANAADVEKAASWFTGVRDTLTTEDRRQVAGKILAKAAALGLTLEQEEALQKAACIGTGPVKQAVDLLYDRAARIARKHQGEAEMLVKLAEAIEANPRRLQDHAERRKLATVIEATDRAAGLDREYAAGLSRPEDVLFAITPKTAMSFTSQNVAIPGGAVYRAEDLERLSVPDLEERLGTDFVKSASENGLFCDAEKLGEALTKAARGTVERFQVTAAEAGVEPVAQEQVVMRLDWSTLGKLAATAAEVD